MAECRKALILHRDDINAAAQSLAIDGENERTRRIIACNKIVVLAQAEVTNDAHQKNLKSATEIQVKEDSILFPQNVSEFIWTCSEGQVVCYTDSGVKIFSKD